MKGIPVVLSAPSGGGKTTIASHLTRKWPDIVESISCTTRPPREGEVNGTDYLFVSRQQFDERVRRGDFLEWAQVHNHYYGTPKKETESQLEKGKDVMMTIDPQGASSVKAIYPDGIFIFLVPPTWDVLVKRLKERNTDNAGAFDVRMKNARKELATLSHYNYLVVNDRLDDAIEDVASIIRAEHKKLSRINKREIPILNG